MINYVKSNVMNVNKESMVFKYYQPVGKKLWLKLANGNIIRVRCSHVTVANSFSKFIHYYEGADGNTYIGSYYGVVLDGNYIGCATNFLYDNYEDCFNNVNRYVYDNIEIGTSPQVLDVYGLIRLTYGSVDFVKLEGVFSRTFIVYGFYNDNGYVKRKMIPFALWIDGNGAHFNVKEFDNFTFFPTEQQAFDTYKPLVIDFSDDDNRLPNKETEVTISITINTEQLIRLTNMGILK